MYLKAPGDSGLNAVDPDLDGDPDELVPFLNATGGARELPACLTIAKGDALEAVREFFRMGKLSERVIWDPA
jgi:hypothetical protein